MPWSWVRVPAATSDKLRECVGNDKSRGRYAECSKEIIEKRSSRLVAPIGFEGNGRHLWAAFEWDDYDDRTRVIYELGAVQVIDLYPPATLDGLAGGSATST